MRPEPHIPQVTTDGLLVRFHGPNSLASGSQPTSSCWRSAGTYASRCRIATSRSCSPNAGSGRPRHHLPLGAAVHALLAEAARTCRHAVGDRWQVDETYVKVAGRWRYVYRAIDQFGQVIDVFVSARRDGAAARRCFQRAIGRMRVAPVEGGNGPGAGDPGV